MKLKVIMTFHRGRLLGFMIPVCFVVLHLWTLVVSISSTDVGIDGGDRESRQQPEEQEQQRQHVTVIGMGSMGSSIAKCFIVTEQHDYAVHVWTRSGGIGELDGVISEDNERLNVHKTARDAITASSLTVVVIDDWSGVVSFINDHKEILKPSDTDEYHNRTVVLFSTYSPIDIQELAVSLSQSTSDLPEITSTSLSLHIVGGAIVGVPSTICSPQSLIMTSMDVPMLTPLGTAMPLPSPSNANDNSVMTHDVGTAALMNLSLVVTIFFGLVGHELAHLMIRRYGVSIEFEKTYQQLASDVAILYTKMLIPGTSKALTSNDFHHMYAPTSAVLRLLRYVVKLKRQLGISDETFLDAHIVSLEQVDDPERDGPPAWTKIVVEQGECFNDPL